MAWAPSKSTAWDHLTLVTPPPADETGMIVSVAEAMLQCRVSPGGIDETSWFTDAIYAAQGEIEGPNGAGIALLTQSWRLSLDRWPRDYIVVPLGPVVSIDGITYQDEAFNVQTLGVSNYVFDLDASPVHIRRAINATWPTLGVIPGAIKVSFTAGFVATGPAWPARLRDLKQAVKLLVSHYYNHRDAVVGVEGRDSSAVLPKGVDAILDRYRVGRFGG
jgi:uncharacterized phiE125 gp8 family phage protein